MSHHSDRNKKRSPLKDQPLRLSGQSLDEELKRLLEDQGYPYAAAVVFSWVLAGLEVWKFYTTASPQPGAYIIVAMIATLLCIYQVLRVRQKARALVLGRDGERAVGQYLERLREQDFQVFHDVMGERFNIDHVLIGEKGVFAIETKTFSKPATGKSSIRFLNGELQVNGRRIDRNPIEQSCAAASWLSDILRESTGRSVKVHPVILFPGWWVERLPPEQNKRIWVLEPKALPKFLENAKTQLSSEDAKLLTYHLSRYIRQTYTSF
ncbi:hypothetical protein C1752_07299 [Acaryochloris thomasi RCC1774]|uniref:NERD domain-containing protein n=1 Tax=Acaryochloris thomasi RCC1774 TaxID=1764569 RepID=A0A2W1JAY8_9CYAN|nr:nuclease-related domain-containing protein [Acaryochloris thomasi]PZD71279.1 hypothetical protein C1752_07299 [Acaryochloris thomasi RCC1774]